MKTIRSELGKKVFHTAVDLFARGQPAPTAAFNRACGFEGATGRTEINKFFDNLVRLGVLQLQATGNGNGKSPFIFNWTGKAIEDVTLLNAVEPFLADEAVPEWQKHRARVAIRLLLNLTRKCSDFDLLIACQRVEARKIAMLPADVRRMVSLSTRHGKQSAKNYESDLRRVIRYAAEGKHIPLIFPANWGDDPWAEAMLKYFPRAETPGDDHPITDAVRSQLRYACRAYKDALISEIPKQAEDYADPGTATPEIERIVIDYHARNGEVTKREACLAMFARLASAYGVGPRVTTLEGMRAYYLSAGEGEAVGGIGGLRRVFEFHSMPPEWQETMEWLEAYETLKPKELRRRGMPTRRNRAIGGKTLAKRATAVRAMLGIAVHRLGLDPTKVTVAEVFGTRFSDIIDEMMEAWAKVQNRRVSGGLKDLIVSAGMISYSLFRKTGHEVAGRRHEEGDGSRKEMRRILQEEEGSVKIGIEADFFEAYRTSGARAAEVTVEMAEQSLTQDAINTEKDVREIMERTPPRYWRAIQREFLREIEAGVKAGRDNHKFHSTVLVAVIHGIILSTACRQNEPTHVRIGTGRHDHYDIEGQADQPNRVISLFKWDRKNGKALNVLLRDTYLPRWLEDFYLTVTRPFFIARGLKGDKKGPRLMARPGSNSVSEELVDTESGLPYSDHPFYLVNTFGVPFGCPEEGEFGQGRDEGAHAVRVGNMAKFWCRHAAKAAAAAGLEIPTGAYGFTLHDIRNVLGYEVKEKYGLEAAANLLGDSVQSIEKYYSAMDGANVELDDDDDDDVMASFAPRVKVDEKEGEISIPAQAVAPAMSAEEMYTAIQKRLTRFEEAKADGTITEEQAEANLMDFIQKMFVTA